MIKTFSLNLDVTLAIQRRYRSAIGEMEREPVDRETRYLTSELPSFEQIKSLIEVAFWGSLQREEGRHHRLKIAVYPKGQVDEQIHFRNALPFDSEHLAKLSPALDPEQTVIGVWPDADELSIWGFCPAHKRQRLIVKVFDAGQIAFDFNASPHSASFSALITGRRVEFIEQDVDPVGSALYWATPMARGYGSQLEVDLPEIARQMHSHAHGGTLLIVPAEANWRESVDDSQFAILPYDPPERPPSEYGLGTPRPSRNRTIHALKSIGQLTAVDGATVVTYGLTALAFGAKIRPRDPDNKPVRVLVSEPFEGKQPEAREVSTLGWGTRHLSAAQFVFDQRGQRPVAIVASQDGRLSVFEWETEREMVSVTRHAEFALL